MTQDIDTMLDVIYEAFRETCTKDELEYIDNTLYMIKMTNQDKMYALGVKCGMIGAFSFCKNKMEDDNI